MRESCQTVRIEKHRVEGITVLTFSDEVGDGETARPLVFVVHGLMSRKERHIELCLLLADAGFLACTLDARHHGERATPEAAALLSGEMDGGFFAAFTDAIVGTVADIGTLASYFQRDHYGVIGHSMGAYISFKAAVADPRAAVIVSISGNPDWTLLPPGVSLPPFVMELAHRESPASYPDRFWPRPLLLLHGDADPTVPVQGVRHLYAALRERYAESPARLELVEYPGLGHEMTPDMAVRAVEWMRRYLTP